MADFELQRPEPFCLIPGKCVCIKNYQFNNVTNKCDPVMRNDTILNTKGDVGFESKNKNYKSSRGHVKIIFKNRHLKIFFLKNIFSIVQRFKQMSSSRTVSSNVTNRKLQVRVQSRISRRRYRMFSLERRIFSFRRR